MSVVAGCAIQRNAEQNDVQRQQLAWGVVALQLFTKVAIVPGGNSSGSVGASQKSEDVEMKRDGIDRVEFCGEAGRSALVAHRSRGKRRQKEKRRTK